VVDLDVCIDLDSSPDLDAYLALNVSLDLDASPDLNASPFLVCIEDGYPANFCLSLAISDGFPSRSTGNVIFIFSRYSTFIFSDLISFMRCLYSTCLSLCNVLALDVSPDLDAYIDLDANLDLDVSLDLDSSLDLDAYSLNLDASLDPCCV